MEKYPSGRRGSPAKGVVCESAARVQIPPSPPPKDTDMDSMSVFFLFAVIDLEIADTGCIPCKYADAAVHLARGNDLLRGVAVACVLPLRKIL